MRILPIISVALSILSSTATLAGQSAPAASGLLITVVNMGDQGVESEIYSRAGGFDLKVGTTDLSGKFYDHSYRCSEDKNLVAKPVDRTYFDSALEPCKSPQKILVTPRLTPKGFLAFDGFSESFLTAHGKSGVVSYGATLQTQSRDFQDPITMLPVPYKPKEHCIVN